MPVRLLAGLLFGVTVAAAWPAHGTPVPITVQCAPSTLMAKIAREKFGAVPVAQGVTAGGGLAQLLESPDGDWAWFVLMPDGVTCVLTDGTGWQELIPAPVGDPS